MADVSITDDDYSIANTGAVVLSPSAALAIAIDATAVNIATALSVGANDIVGTTGLINYDLFDVAASGAVLIINSADVSGLTIAPTIATTTAITLTDDDIVNALSIATNTILGTTAVIDFTDFDVSADGLVALAPDSGVDADLNYMDIATPAITATAATTVDVYSISAAGALNTTADVGAEVMTYNGINLALPAINTAEAADTTALTGLMISAGAVTDGAGTETSVAIDVTDADIVTALSVAANDIVGTTGLINYTNFDVNAAGNITVAAAEGLDTNGAGALELGFTNATSVLIGTTAATTLNLGAGGALARAINIGTGTGIDTIAIGGGATVIDAITIGDALADVSITDDDY
ncbi:MAG: hypothetical protein AAB222_07925, partial [Candidatus Binatota bacterium]